MKDSDLLRELKYELALLRSKVEDKQSTPLTIIRADCPKCQRETDHEYIKADKICYTTSPTYIDIKFRLAYRRCLNCGNETTLSEGSRGDTWINR